MINRLLNSLKLYLTPDMNAASTATQVGDRRGLIYKVRQQAVYRIEAEIKNLRTAIDAAESPLRPNRQLLYALYRQIELDDQVVSQIRIACATVSNAPFIVSKKDGSPNPELIRLFKRPWFLDYLLYCLETEFWGHTLIEFDPTRKGMEFERLIKFPRPHVRPEYGDVIPYTSDQKGVPFRNNKDFKYVLEIGKPDDLGLFRIIAVPAIRKRYSDTDWSLFSEKFGMPFLTIKTASRQKDELDAKEAMAKNFGSAGWAILDDQDELQTMVSNHNGTAHLTYSDRMDRADDQIARLINGQTGASDEKAYVGSAEVHERLLNDFVKWRLTQIQNHINFHLIPLLVQHGYPLSDCEFQFTELLEKQARPTTSDAPTAPSAERSRSEKKKLDLSEMYQYVPKVVRGTKLSFNPIGSKTNQQAATEIKNGQVRAGQLSATLWAEYVDTLMQALSDGAEKDLSGGLDYRDRDFDLFKKLRHNIYAFAAAKSRTVVNDLANAAGRSDYDTYANIRLGRYNGDWLETEYRLGVANTQMAIRWQDYQDRADTLPYLRYVTARDERVREAHKILHGVTLPIDDPFWDEYLPPNGYNCRCIVQQTAGPRRDPEALPDENQVPRVMRENAGKTGNLYSLQHPYFAGVGSIDLQIDIQQQAAVLPVFDLVYQSQGKLLVHPITHPTEYDHLERIGRGAADAGQDITLLPYVEEEYRMAQAQGYTTALTLYQTDPRATLRQYKDQGYESVLFYNAEPLSAEQLAVLEKAATEFGLVIQVVHGSLTNTYQP